MTRKKHPLWMMWTVRQQIRAKLHLRQGGKCFYCRHQMARTGDRCTTIDHYVPKAAGGSDDEDNLVGACWLCNQRKSSMSGDAFRAILRLETMPGSTAVIGAAFAALIATKVAKIWKDERSDRRAMDAAARLLCVAQARAIPEPIDPDQDCTGDMPEKSSVRLDIEQTQARANEFGGATRLRYPGRWKARFHEARPAAPERDWC